MFTNWKRKVQDSVQSKDGKASTLVSFACGSYLEGFKAKLSWQLGVGRATISPGRKRWIVEDLGNALFCVKMIRKQHSNRHTDATFGSVQEYWNNNTRPSSSTKKVVQVCDDDGNVSQHIVNWMLDTPEAYHAKYLTQLADCDQWVLADENQRVGKNLSCNHLSPYSRPIKAPL